ncbi:hypothetical protein N7475_001678 [Penicillium sp. IBT 31633x]|nr:hypothetical protein N7475_001678 [Penicillium sp. IBT 31633x]
MPPVFQITKNIRTKTYNSEDSLVVTHPTTNSPACGLSTAERTGSPVFHTLWSYKLRNRWAPKSSRATGGEKGINLYPATDNDSSSCAIGYRIPASEKWVEIPPFSGLRAIRVAFRAEGLTGVKFVFEDSESFDWVGDTRSSGIAFGILAIQKEGSDWPYLLAGLDHFKIVSLGLSKMSKCSSTDMVDSFDIQSCLWKPHPPSAKDLRFSPMLPTSGSSPTFEPLITIDFGGPGGVLLGLLTRLTFYMMDGPSPLVGIEIF